MFGIIKNVARHSFIYAMADMVSKAVGFILIPLYTHYLSTADYGTLELLDLTSYIIALFFGMGISQSMVRYYYEYEDEKRKSQVVSVAMITVMAISLIVLGALFIFSRNISTLVFKSPDYYRMFNIVFVTIAIGIINEIPLTLLRIEEKSVFFVTINLIKLVISLSLNILFLVHYKMGIIGILISGLISAGAAGLFLIFYHIRKVGFACSFQLLLPMLRYGLPLVFGTLGMFVLNFGDRFLLQRLTSLADVGIYSLAYKFGFLPNVLVLSPFLMFWGPKRFDLLKEPDAKSIYAVIFSYLMYVEFFIGLGIAVLIRDVIKIIADSEFFESYKYVPVLLLSYIFNGTYYYVQFGVHLKKETKYLAYATFTGAALNIGANLLFIPRWQVAGAALATLVSFLYLAIFIYIFSQKLYYIPYEFGRLAKMCLTALVLFAVSKMINIPHLALSIIIKSCIVLAFPFALYLIKFYTDKELEKMSDLRSRLISLLKPGGSRRK
jgi:O-antigen/teichoic acid export membrane protein